ncbi:hypothetical protein [Marinilabilia salmonicolor]|jgi:hypothetical protein|uniref:Uncharacterized protein n=1 Tax=Marinilabilia salmonicolor TaxID=989 RepID=A0A368UWX8_9BACT|nr:hypothetical protein [Marinilabilia salmonicolor]RCW33322.1 hypothetical protein DFO77_11388 [Marinilabilia salmonicolor]
MAALIYTTTKFNEPGLISKEMYEVLKMKYNNDNNYNLVSEHDSFQDMVGSYYLWMIISFVVMIMGFGLGEGITTVIGGFAMMSLITSVIYYISEAPSKSKFVKERNIYLTKLESVIKESVDYDDFTMFYKIIDFGGSSKSYILTKRRQR